MEIMVERRLSHRTEEALLGAILLDNQYLLAAMNEGIKSKHFQLAHTRRIFTCMAKLRLRRQPIDIVTLTTALHGSDELAPGVESDLNMVGGLAYLASLTRGISLRPSIESYARILHEDYWARSRKPLA